MVSGDIHNYKTSKGYYSPPMPSHMTAHSKRFSESPSLRPWPPMYKSTSSRSSNGSYQMSPKLNFNNINNGLYSNSSVYGSSVSGSTRNKFNFHPLNGGHHASSGKYSSTFNMSNGKNAKNYYLVSQPYMKNSMLFPAAPAPFYGRDGNVLAMEKDRSDKNRFRKLRNPTQQSPPQRGSCACVRSKSMEDVRTEIVTDWKAYNNGKDSFQHINGKLRGNGLGSAKINTRRSMDNLLDVDTVYGKQFQVMLTGRTTNYEWLTCCTLHMPTRLSLG